MFGFISKFKSEVIAGFDAVHQRLVTLEARVEALFEHNKVISHLDPSDNFIKQEEVKVETVVTDAAKTVEAAVDAKQDTQAS